MGNKLTASDYAALYAPFSLSSHYIESNVRGDKVVVTFNVKRSTIQKRLNEIDPNWQFEVSHIDAGQTFIGSYGSLTINGVRRGTTAGSTRDDLPIEVTYKGAGTDLFKRCATLFGIFDYMYEDAPRVILTKNTSPEGVQAAGIRALRSYLPTLPGYVPENDLEEDAHLTGMQIDPDGTLTFTTDTGHTVKSKNKDLFYNHYWFDQGELEQPNMGTELTEPIPAHLFEYQGSWFIESIKPHPLSNPQPEPEAAPSKDEDVVVVDSSKVDVNDPAFWEGFPKEQELEIL